MPDVLLQIDGNWRDGHAGATLPIVNPATDETIGRVAMAGIPDLDAALGAGPRHLDRGERKGFARRSSAKS